MDTQESPVLVLNVQFPSSKRRGILGRLLEKLSLTKIFRRKSHSKTPDLQEFFNALTTMSQINSQFSGPPPPIIKLTMEQEFKMRQIEDAIRGDIDKEDLITVFLALQRQCYVLGNNMSNLLKQWNKQDPLTTDEVLSKFGISSETNN